MSGCPMGYGSSAASSDAATPAPAPDAATAATPALSGVALVSPRLAAARPTTPSHSFDPALVARAQTPGAVYYSTYLGLDKILDAQAPESGKTKTNNAFCHDEMLFIITHQTYELWFKQIIFELDSIRDSFLKGPAELDRELFQASSRLERIIKIQQTLVSQVDILETMTPLDFLDFREHLTPASGFQSYQFRLIENKIGLPSERTFQNKPVYEHLHQEHKEAVLEAAHERTLFSVVEEWLERIPFLEMGEYHFWKVYKEAAVRMLERDRQTVEHNPLLSDENRARELKNLEATMESFRSIFDEDVHNALVEQGRRRLSHRATLAALLITLYREEPILQLPFKFLEQLVEMDHNFSLWRYRHMVMAGKMIGTKIGTGGSAGQGYLHKTVRSEMYRAFLDLENLSTYLLPRGARPQLPEAVLTRLRFPSSITSPSV